MNRLNFVKQLKGGLKSKSPFAIEELNTHFYRLRSAVCCIDLLFERYEESYNIQLSEATCSNEPMMILLLNFLRKIHLYDGLDSDGAYLAKFLNDNYLDIIDGDFGIRSEYENVADEFFNKLLYLSDLSDSDPIKIKFDKFDLSWIDDIKPLKK